MKYPKRPDKHVTEAESWRLLQSLAPKEWIVREVSERDYGIDAYIELVTKAGEVTGNLMSVQLKGTKEVEWKPSDSDFCVARSPSVKTSTAAYWLGLPMPVFLFVADLHAGDIYYVAVKEAIRAQFDNLDKQESISFRLADKLSLKSEGGIEFFNYLNAREKMHEQFTFHISNLINQVNVFSDFIRGNQNRDCFLEVEAERHLQFRALYESCRMASLCLGKKWELESLNDLYKKDRDEWKDDYVYLHEQTLDYALQNIEKVFPDLVRNALRLVSEKQASYWRAKSPVFFNLCSSGELDWLLRRVEGESGC